MSQRVILSVTNDLTIDNRLHKVCTTLSNSGFSVLLVGRQRKKSLPLKERAYSTHRIQMIFDRGKLFYLEYNLKLFFFLFLKKVDILTANDHDVLLPNLLVSKLRFKKLVFDCHEYFTELPELVQRPITRFFWVILERLAFPFIKQFSTVNKTIQEIYSKKYNKNILVIPNVPRIRTDINREKIAGKNITLIQDYIFSRNFFSINVCSNARYIWYY